MSQTPAVAVPATPAPPVSAPAPPPPPFSSYDPSEITWLLSDLSDADLELATEDREEQIQGGGHYSEMLPVEFQPDAAYTELFRTSLDESAARLAGCVGLLGELLLARHASAPITLVSLARAGTPVGILLRRWFAHTHGLDVAHYTVSIIRGKGLDLEALDYIRARHSDSSIRFIDGWTGKGAISKELALALAPFPEIDPELAVLADPGACTSLYGTRDDFLIPSACLNSTVSGLISRTVLRDDLITPGMFHGAKFYSELLPVDLSNHFLDVVSAQFDRTRAQVLAQMSAHEASDRSPTWAGWRSLTQIAERFGIEDMNLVKPGVGETTRVLLRRVPWKILVHPAAAAELTHVALLARARGVALVEDASIAYSCVGLIKPLASGRSAGGSVHPVDFSG